jgi:signal transduction histidine kinase
MKATKLSVLHLEHDPDDADRIRDWISREAPNYRLVSADTLEAGRAVLLNESIDAVLLDLELPGAADLDALQALREEFPNIPVVVMTERDDRAFALETLRNGAQDYLLKQTLTPAVVTRTLLYSVERRQAEARIRLKNQQCQAVFQAVPVGIALLDTGGTVVMANNTLRRRLRRKELKGLMFTDLVNPSSRDLTRNILSDVAKKGEFDQVEDVLFQDVDEWGVLRGVVLSPEDDSDPQMVVSVEFVTERRRLESNLLRSQKMETVGRLAGGIAHDFNNLLTAQLGNVHLIEQSLPHDSPLEAELEGIKSCAERAAHLTRKLLTFSRQQTVQPEPFVLCDLIEGMAETIKRLVGDRVSLSLDLQSRDLVVVGDVSEFEQGILNLCLNAGQAMNGDGSLHLGVSYRKEQDREWAEIVVVDDGAGMSELVKGKALEPFFTTRPEQSGLGLSTVFGTMTSMGGTLSIESVPDQGTTVRIRLPVSKRQILPPVDTEIDGGRCQRNMLLVEDDPAVRAVIPRYFRKQGFQVWEVDGVAHARAVLKQLGSTLDVVVSDVVMPGESGQDLADWLSQEYPNLPVILISGYSPDLNLRSRVREGQLHFLAKPFAPKDLLRLVDTVVQSGPEI